MPTLAPPTVLTPDTTKRVYRDPDFGFTFEYPANWWIDAPNLPCRPVPLKGTDVQVRNFTPFLKGAGNLEIFKIEVTVTNDFAGHGTIEEWLARAGKQDVSLSRAQTQALTVSGLPAVRLTWENGAETIAFGKGQWLYRITGFWSTNQYCATFEDFLKSFKVP